MISLVSLPWCTYFSCIIIFTHSGCADLTLLALKTLFRAGVGNLQNMQKKYKYMPTLPNIFKKLENKKSQANILLRLFLTINYTNSHSFVKFFEGLLIFFNFAEPTQMIFHRFSTITYFEKKNITQGMGLKYLRKQFYLYLPVYTG